MIISSTGEVVTNNHVIALAETGASITVTESGTTKKEGGQARRRGPEQRRRAAPDPGGVGPADDHVRRLEQAARRRCGRRHRQRPRAGRGNADGDAGDRLGARPDRDSRRQRLGGDGTADEHDPDRRGDQPRELRRTADRHGRTGRRHEHGRRGQHRRRYGRPEHRLRHPGRQRRVTAAAAPEGRDGRQRRGRPRRRRDDPDDTAPPAVRVHADVRRGDPQCRLRLAGRHREAAAGRCHHGHRFYIGHLGPVAADGRLETQGRRHHPGHVLRRRPQADGDSDPRVPAVRAATAVEVGHGRDRDHRGDRNNKRRDRPHPGDRRSGASSPAGGRRP